MELSRAAERQADYFPSPTSPSSVVTTWVSANPILALQRKIGNRAVGRLLDSSTLQAKFAVSQPPDIYEQEADRVEDLVLRRALRPIQLKYACVGAGPNEYEEGRKSRVELPSSAIRVHREDRDNRNIEEAPTIARQVRSSPGLPLDEQTRSFTESRFEHDFSSVGVHSDTQAALTTEAVYALPYSAGPNVAFGAGQYTPSSTTGRGLQAHELTHVLQQSVGSLRQKADVTDLPDRYDRADSKRRLTLGNRENASTPVLQRRVVCDPEDPDACWEEPDSTVETPAEQETPVNGPPAPGESAQAPTEEQNPISEPPAPEESTETPSGPETPIYGPPAPEESAEETPTSEPPASQEQAETPAKDETAAEGSEAAEQTPGEDQETSETESEESAKVTIPLKQKVNVGSYPVDVNYATLKFGIAVEVGAEIEAGSKTEEEGETGERQETSVTPLGYDSNQIAIAIGHAWINKDGVNIIGWDTAFTEVKLEGGVKVDKGFEVNLEGSGKLACGVEVKLELNLLKIEENWEVKGPGVTLAVELPWFPFDVDLGLNVKLKDVQVHPVIEVEVEPNYKRILSEVGKDIGEEAVGEQVVEKAGEAGAALLGADALIIGGILLAGAGSIGAAILTVQEGDEIAETHGQCVALAAKLTEGFRIGVAGGPSPSEKEMIPGYVQGIRNFNAAVSNLKEQNPDADDATIKAAVAAQADTVTEQAQSQIMDMSKDTVWNKYASGHLDTWYHSYDFDRWAAWSNIYGSDPRGDPRYTRYCPDHTCQHGM